MKIVITINTSWNIFNFRLGLLKALMADGHQIIAVSPMDSYVDKLKDIGIEHYPIGINQKGTNPFEDFKVIKTYKTLFKEIKPDMILSYTIKPNIYCSIAAQRLGIFVVNNVSGLGTLFIKKSISTYVAKLLYKLAFKNSSWVFFQNNVDKDLFIDSKIVGSSIVSVLPGSGVNTSVFSTNKIKNSGKKFLFVGRLIGDKGIREYLMAANELSTKYLDLEFNIVGELGYANNTSISKDELDMFLVNKQIRFLGKTDNIIKLLVDTDIMVLPSYREGLSKSLIEAASMSLPIVTTNVPGCREVVENGVNGYLCNAKDFIDLKNKMEQMILISEDDRLLMGRKGREKVVTSFDENIVIDLYKQKINELLI